MNRKGLSLRRRVTLCQTVPLDCIPKSLHKYQDSNIFAMDETACWMDMPSETTVTLTGARSVPMKTTGHERDHFTVILTAKANGTKLKPSVVFKGKGTRLIKLLEKIPGIIVTGFGKTYVVHTSNLFIQRTIKTTGNGIHTDLKLSGRINE